MKIVVCVKQVPEVTDVQVDPATGTLIREGVQSILNPFCEYAMDHALRLARRMNNVEITAISMGPAQARAVLLRCLELGAHQAVLVSDRRFAGADTWATACTLAAAIKRTVPDFDLILAGKQAIDGDTAQVGPEIAEILGLPQVTYGVELLPGVTSRTIQVNREVEAGNEVLECLLPALVTFSKGEPCRLAPSLVNLAAAREKTISTLDADLLELTESGVGLRGSYTQVVKVFPPERKKGCRMVANLDPEKAAQAILQYLRENRFLQKRETDE